MHWLFTRPAERDACRRIKQLGGSFILFGRMPFAAHVTSIYLRETNVADGDLSLVHMIPRLDSVELGYTSITDRGIAQIATHPAIRYLFLWGTQITDDCLESLSRMQQLSMLVVSQTDITKGGFGKLTTRLPNCLLSHVDFGTVFQGNDGPTARCEWLDRDKQVNP